MSRIVPEPVDLGVDPGAEVARQLDPAQLPAHTLQHRGLEPNLAGALGADLEVPLQLADLLGSELPVQVIVELPEHLVTGDVVELIHLRPFQAQAQAEQSSASWSQGTTLEAGRRIA